MALPPTPLTSVRGHAKNDSLAIMLGGGGGGVPHPLQLTTGIYPLEFCHIRKNTWEVLKMGSKKFDWVSWRLRLT